MIKKTIKFKDFNDVERTEDLYFHVSKASTLTSSDGVYNEIMSLAAELQKRADTLGKLKAEDYDNANPFTENGKFLTESAMMVGRLLDRIVDFSYGKRSEDGLRFVRNQQVLDEFKSSAAYDAFVSQLLSNQDEIISFINTLLPVESNPS